nr:hypothetical protein CE91St29_14340 [Corynebacterium striatum]
MEADPATGNNNDQGKCLGTKLGALQLVVLEGTNHVVFLIGYRLDCSEND